MKAQLGKMFIALDQTNAFFSGTFQHANLFGKYLYIHTYMGVLDSLGSVNLRSNSIILIIVMKLL